MANAIGRAIGRPGDDHAAVAVPDQDDVAQIFVMQEGNNVVDMAVEVDTGSEQVRSLA